MEQPLEAGLGIAGTQPMPPVTWAHIMPSPHGVALSHAARQVPSQSMLAHSEPSVQASPTIFGIGGVVPGAHRLSAPQMLPVSQGRLLLQVLVQMVCDTPTGCLQENSHCGEKPEAASTTVQGVPSG